MNLEINIQKLRQSKYLVYTEQHELAQYECGHTSSTFSLQGFNNIGDAYTLYLKDHENSIILKTPEVKISIEEL